MLKYASNAGIKSRDGSWCKTSQARLKQPKIYLTIARRMSRYAFNIKGERHDSHDYVKLVRKFLSDAQLECNFIFTRVQINLVKRHAAMRKGCA